MPRPPEIDHAFSVRVRRAGPTEARAYARRAAFALGSQASLRPRDAHPSAVELLLGALGGDLVHGLAAEAARRGIALHGVEASLAGRLDNILVHLGVVGEEGSPALATVTGTLYAAADADRAALEPAWRAALERSPLYQTLRRCATIAIELRVTP